MALFLKLVWFAYGMPLFMVILVPVLAALESSVLIEAWAASATALRNECSFVAFLV